jgi:hypothetical protein
MVESGQNLTLRCKIVALSASEYSHDGAHRMSARGLMRRIPARINLSGEEITLVGLATMFAISIAVLFANVLLLPLRVYLTGTVTASAIDQCREQGMAEAPGRIYTVRTRGSSDFIPIAMCDPEVSGDGVTVVDSKIAATTVAVRGTPTLVKIYFGLDGPYAKAFIAALLLGCGLTLYRAKTILRFGSEEVRKAWSPVTSGKDDRWKSLTKASEVLTDFLFLGLIVVATGLVVYALFRTTLYIHGETWFSVLAVGSLAIIWSSIPLKVITLAWKTYKSSLFVILRNLVSGLLMLGSIRTIYKMPHTAEFTSIHGLLTFVVTVLKVSIGLDAK